MIEYMLGMHRVFLLDAKYLNLFFEGSMTGRIHHNKDTPPERSLQAAGDFLACALEVRREDKVLNARSGDHAATVSVG